MLRAGIRSNTHNSHIPSLTERKLGQSRGWRTSRGICDELPSGCRTKRKCPTQNVNLTVRTRLGEGQVLRATQQNPPSNNHIAIFHPQIDVCQICVLWVAPLQHVFSHPSLPLRQHFYSTVLARCYPLYSCEGLGTGDPPQHWFNHYPFLYNNGR